MHASQSEDFPLSRVPRAKKTKLQKAKCATATSYEMMEMSFNLLSSGKGLISKLDSLSRLYFLSLDDVCDYCVKADFPFRSPAKQIAGLNLSIVFPPSYSRGKRDSSF